MQPHPRLNLALALLARPLRKGAAFVAAALAMLLILVMGSMAAAQDVPRMVKLGVHTPKVVTSGEAKLIGQAPASQHMHLVLGLQSQHLAEQEKFLQDVQTKGTPVFHQFLTAAQWNARFAPSAQDEQAVVDWASAQGLVVTQRFGHRLVVDVEGPVTVVERALAVTINRYQMSANGGVTKQFYSSDRDPSVPAHLANVIHSIGGLNDVQVLLPANKERALPDFSKSVAGPGKAIGPSQGLHADGSRLPSQKTNGKTPAKAMAAAPKPFITGGAYDPSDMYNSNAYDTNALYALGHCCNPLHNPNVTPPETSIAIATAGTQNTSDFTGFHNAYPYLASHYQIFYIDGTPVCCDAEGTMDFEWSTAMSNSFGSYVDTAMVYMYDGINTQFSTFTDIYSHMLNDGYARILSNSYGCAEFDCYPQSVMDTEHGIFNAMVGQGWTIVSAAGDGGATSSAGTNPNTCTTHDSVSYPASDPNVLAAGGTSLSLSSGPFYNYETTWTGNPDGCASNGGGTGGGFSAYWPTPGYQSNMGYGSRSIPDIALNADWYNTPQNLYFNGGLGGNGGTSIVAPELAGFFANENAYLLYLSTVTGGLCNGHACAPLGNPNYRLYYFGNNPGYAPHYPYYDITTGCNNNDYTAFYGLGYYCARGGHDQTTGWGSVNMLQLAWAINTYQAGDFGGPVISFTSGPQTERWYNTDQSIAWTVRDTTAGGLPATGVAGFSQAWDVDPGDVSRQSTPGSGNSFYSGPQFPNSTSGCLSLAGGFGCAGGVSQGWHTVYVRAWDNTGVTSGGYTYGRIGYDTIAPVTTAQLSSVVTPVTVSLAATDNASGVSSTSYQLDGAAAKPYGGAFVVTPLGPHTVLFHSTDVAGNVESTRSLSWTELAPTRSTLVSSKNPSGIGSPVVFTASVTSTTPGTIGGTVTFKDGTKVLGSAALASGKASLTTAALGGGSHGITATYLGAGFYQASTSATLIQQVTQGMTTTSLLSSRNPAMHGVSVTFAAVVKSTTQGTPTGTVTFKDGAAVLGTAPLVAARATLSTTALSTASHSITAVYASTPDFAGSTSAPLIESIVKATSFSTVSASTSTSTYRQAVIFTARVASATTGTPSGTATFKDGATVLGTVALTAGEATLSTAALAVGPHAITVAYGGSADFVGSTSTSLSHTVVAEVTHTVLASSRNPSVYGTAVVLTATVTPAAGGTIAGSIVFKQGSTTLGTVAVNASGKAALITSTLPAGANVITAVYGGSPTLATSTSPALTQTVTKATTATTLKSSLNPATAGAAVTFTAKVTSPTAGTPTSAVTFKSGGTTLATVNLAGGAATFTTSTLSVGSHNITAVYGGEPNASGSTSPVVTEVIH